jgi:hypothetical protein
VIKNLNELSSVNGKNGEDAKKREAVNINAMASNTFNPKLTGDSQNLHRYKIEDEFLGLDQLQNSEDKSLLNALTLKMKMAEKLLMESHKMRQYESQFTHQSGGQKIFSSKTFTRQGRMALLKDIKKFVSDFETDCKEIELLDTMVYLKKIIDATDNR